ncbi:MAG: autotransporter-associated beta strand repeat-containing protein [Kiritimatiellales bacterium]
MKTKLNFLFGTAVLINFFTAAAAMEVDFYSDRAGLTLPQAYGGAAFTNTGNADVMLTDGLGGLRSTLHDASTDMWRDGSIYSAIIPSPSVYFLRYDFTYDFSNPNGTNETGTVLGFSFSDSSGSNIAGVALQYDVGASNTPPAAVTELETGLADAGSVSVIARIDITSSPKTLSVWYTINGDITTKTESVPDKTATNINITSISQLRFQATGDFVPAESETRVTLLRAAESWDEIIAAPRVVSGNGEGSYLNEWTFERDRDGIFITEAINSGTSSPLAQFATGSPSVYVTNRALICVGEETNGWDGLISDAAIPPAAAGKHYLRYDLEYSFTNSSRSSGTLLGVYFTGDSGAKAAGLVLGYDDGNLESTAPSNRTLTAITNNLDTTGTLTAIAEVDLETKTLNVWYDFEGGSGLTTNTPAMFTSNNIALTSISNLCFHATGSFRPSGSEDYAAVDNIRHAASLAEIMAEVADDSLEPNLTVQISDELGGAMDIGEPNEISVVISNSGGQASAVISELTVSPSGGFVITSTNTPVVLGWKESVTNTYDIIATANGQYQFTARAVSAETNSPDAALDIAVGSSLGIDTTSITEISGGLFADLNEPGETLRISVTVTNNGSKSVSNIVSTLSGPGIFSISPSPAPYSLTPGTSTQIDYTVVISASAGAGNYTLTISNQSGANIWTESISLDVFIRKPGERWVKDDNNDDLNLASSWTSGAVPNATDTAVMDSTVTSPITTKLGGNLSWKGMALVSNNVPWTISDTNYSLTIGSSGVDMSGATENLTLDAKTILGTTQVWAVATSRVLTVSGNISGTTNAALIKTGDGELALDGVNSYAGGTVLSNGILSVANEYALGFGTLTADNAMLVAAANLNTDITLTGAMILSNATPITVAGHVTGSGSLMKTGNGELTLANANAYSGGTTNSGKIILGHHEALGTGPVVLENGSSLMSIAGVHPSWNNTLFALVNDIILSGDATLGTLTVTADGGLFVHSGRIIGTNQLTLSGYRIALSGDNNDFSGDIVFDTANWLYATPSALGNGKGTIYAAPNRNNSWHLNTGGIVSNDISIAAVNNRGVTFNQVNNTTIIFEGKISGGNATSFLDFPNAGGTIIFRGDNSGYIGRLRNVRASTVTHERTIRFEHPKAIASMDSILIGHASGLSGQVMFEFNAPLDPVTTKFELQRTSDKPVIFKLNNDIEFNGAFSDGTAKSTHGIQKTGAKKMTLNAASAYSSKFEIKEGTLEVNAAFDDAEFTVRSGAVLSGSGSVKSASMDSGSALDLSSGGMTFKGDLIQTGSVSTLLAVNTTTASIQGNGSNILKASGTLVLDFAGNSSATNGASFTVLSNWGYLSDEGLQVLPVNLPPFVTLDTSNLFNNGTVRIMSATGGSSGVLGSESIIITVPQGDTGTESLILSNAGMSAIAFEVQANWPSGSYTVTNKPVDRREFISFPGSTGSTLLKWNGSHSVPENIGFNMRIFGILYSSFSVSDSGSVTLMEGEHSIRLKPYSKSTSLSPTDAIHFVQDTYDGANRLVVSWGYQTGKELQVWLLDDGRIMYLYQFGTWEGGEIAIGNQIISHSPGSSSRDCIVMTPSSSTWVRAEPQSGGISSGQYKSVVFSADASNMPVGIYIVPAKVVWNNKHSQDLSVAVNVVNSTVQLDIPSGLIFSGPAGYITTTNIVVTNSGNSGLNFSIIDEGTMIYSAMNTDFAWTELPSQGTLVAPQDLGIVPINIGFPFAFSGTAYTSLIVRADGTVVFSDRHSASPFKASLSGVQAWTRNGGLGDRNRFYITWTDASGSNSFRAVLNRSGNIDFHYKQLGTNWNKGTIQIETDKGIVSTALSSNLATTVGTNYTQVQVITTNGFYPNFRYTTNYQNRVDGYITRIFSKSVSFNPKSGAVKVITASPRSGYIASGSNMTITINGDARSLKANGSYQVTNNTALIFNYHDQQTLLDVQFTATNSASISYNALMASQSALAGVQPQLFNVTSSINSDGSRTISWPAPADELSRTYNIWFTTNLTAGWTHLTTVYNTGSFVDDQHNDEPVIFYKVVVQ